MKNFISILVLSMLFFTACNNKDSKQEEGTEDQESVALNPDNLVKYDMDVSGMTCTGCESTIESGVNELPGISSIEAMHMQGKAIVSFDSTMASIEDVKTAIESKGYKVVGAHKQAMPEPTSSSEGSVE